MSINYELLGRCLSSRISNYSNYNFFTLGKSFINYVDNDDLHFKYEGEIIDYIEYTCKSLMIGTEYVYSFIEWFMDEFDTDIKSSIKLSILGAHNSTKLTFRVLKSLMIVIMLKVFLILQIVIFKLIHW